MSPDDLRKMLGMKPEGFVKKPKEEPTLIRPLEPEKERKPLPDGIEPSRFALVVDRFDIDHGKVLWKDREDGDVISPEDLSDFFVCAFVEEPLFEEWSLAPRRQEFIRTMMDSPEYAELRVDTELNVVASNIAANRFADAWVKLKGKDERRKRGERKPGDVDGDLLGAVDDALEEAEEEVSEMKDGLYALEAMGGPGIKTGVMADPKKVVALWERIKKDPQLRKICENAGRFRLAARSKQKSKTVHGVDEVAGVELGGDLQKIVPEELALLVDPDFELDSMRRLVEDEMMQVEMHGREYLGKGPICLVVDESGSMSGTKVHTAKALCLAMAWVARHQKRWCCLIGYSGGEMGNLLALPWNAWNEDKLCDWLTHFYGAGSMLDVPLDRMAQFWQKVRPPAGKTDVIFITDAQCNINQRVRQDFLAWKAAEQVRAIALVLNAYPGHLAEVCDECHLIAEIAPGVEGVDRCLSL
jgi:uncharacterized protein with von Willebrand factor type A (vWA) domain